MESKHFNLFRLNVILFFTFASLHSVFTLRNTIHMNDACSFGSTQITSLAQRTGFVKAGPRTHYEAETCTLVMLPGYKRSLLLSVFSYDLSNQDLLTIADADGHTIGLVGSGLFRDERKTVLSGGKVTLSYSRGNASGTGFQFTYTVLTDSPCSQDEFECKNGKCIPKDLICDGHNHCGDFSDQFSCVRKEDEPQTRYEKSNYSYFMLMGISLGAAILLIVLVVCSVYLVRRKKARKEAASANATTPVPLQSVTTSVAQGPSPQTPQGQQAPQEHQAHNRHQDHQVPQEHQAHYGHQENQNHPAPQRETFFSRVQRSLRGRKDPVAAEESQQKSSAEMYQVPSMYPSLEHLPSAPELEGITNPDFKADE